MIAENEIEAYLTYRKSIINYDRIREAYINGACDDQKYKIAYAEKDWANLKLIVAIRANGETK